MSPYAVRKASSMSMAWVSVLPVFRHLLQRPSGVLRCVDRERVSYRTTSGATRMRMRAHAGSFDRECLEPVLPHLSCPTSACVRIRLLGQLAEMDRKHYPGRGGVIYVINTPPLFGMVWKGISQVMMATKVKF